jgi:hypothetical protein
VGGGFWREKLQREILEGIFWGEILGNILEGEGLEGNVFLGGGI